MKWPATTRPPRWSTRWLKRRRSGMLVMMIAMTILTSSSLSVFEYFKHSIGYLRQIQNEGNRLRAFYCAKTGFEAAMTGLKKIEEKYLYQTQLAFNPPELALGGCTVYFKLIPEDGKLNVNYLYNSVTQQESARTRDIWNKLFESLDLDPNDIDLIVDYMDEDADRRPSGMEIDDYESMQPPRHIKNDFLYSLEELYSIPGFTMEKIGLSRKPKDYDEKYSEDFLTDDEKLSKCREDADWILANNITAYVKENMEEVEETKVNINAAPCFVLRSLSEFMTEKAIARIMRMRRELGYITQKDMQNLKNYAEFQIKTTNEITLFEDIEKKIKAKGRFYKIIGFGIYNETEARITGILDKNSRQLIYYKEY